MLLDELYAKADALDNVGEYEAAFSAYLEAAEQGHVEAMARVATMYSDGIGVYPDFEKSIYWDRKSIEGGNKLSLLNLAITYRMMGDLVQYKYWLEESLEAGDGEAALQLAKLYMVSDKESETVRNLLETAISHPNMIEASVEEAKELLSGLGK